MKYDPVAIKQQIDQHQLVIETLEKQKVGLDQSITKLQEEIDKLKQILELMSSVGK